MYYGIFFKTLVKGVLEKDILDKHITCVFKPSAEQEKVMKAYLGKEYAVKVVGYANDGKNEGLLCEPVDSFPYYGANKMHITLSVSKEGKPVNTAFLDFKPIEEPYTIVGVMGVHP